MRLQLGKWSSLICESVKIATMPVHNRISQTKGKAKRGRESVRGGHELSRHATGVLNVRLSSVGSMPLRTKPLRRDQPGLPGVPMEILVRALNHSHPGRLELSRHAAGVLNGRLSSVGSMPLRTKPLRDIALIVGDVHCGEM